MGFRESEQYLVSEKVGFLTDPEITRVVEYATDRLLPFL